MYMSGAQDVTRPNPVPTFFNPRDANKLFGPKPRNPTTLGHEIPRPLRSPEHQASVPFNGTGTAQNNTLRTTVMRPSLSLASTAARRSLSLVPLPLTLCFSPPSTSFGTEPVDRCCLGSA